jgi:hypothetical protein
VFINSVLSHLKDFLRFESDPRTKLEVEYRQIEGQGETVLNKQVFACYIYVLKDESAMQKMMPKAPKPL